MTLTRIANKLKSLGKRRVKTPTVLQMEAVECGAAALGIVMEYYGKIVPLEQLRVACGVSRNGSIASNLLQAARRYGFRAKGYKRSPEKVRQGPLPVIVHWNFNHFLVVEGVAPDKVHLNDPDSGPRTVSRQEFDDSFTGVVLEVEPGRDFQKSGSHPSLVRTLYRRLQGSGKALAYLLLASLLLTLIGIVTPAFSRIFVDQFLVAGLDSWLLPLFLSMGVAVLLIAGLTWVLHYFLLRLEIKLAVTTSSQFFWHVLRLPLDFFQQRRAADISARVGLNDQIAKLLSGEVATNLINLVLIAFYTVVMWRYDHVLTLLGTGFALLNIVALRYFARRRVDANKRSLNERGKLTAVSFSGLQMIETLKATGRESDYFARWAGTQAKVVNAEQDLGLATEFLTAVPAILASVNSALIITIGGWRIMNGQLSFGELIAFQALIASFMLPVNQVVNLAGRLQRTQGQMARLDDVMKYPIDPHARQTDDPEAITPQTMKLAGHVELRDVTFGYSRLAPPLIKAFSLTLKPGARVALVGASGSGKSTIAKLVAGIYRPWSGQILFDGRPPEEVPRTQLKNSLSLVDQDIYLYEGSSRENITLWDGTVPEENVVRAAKDAAIHDELVSRPGGYDYQINEGGGNLSGGQQQRLEIARALVNDPTVLVLDEATSALDPITEKTIDDNLRRRGCTCLIVAHRLSTIRDCDEIIVMEDGAVVQRGTHEEMIRARGPYAHLIKTNEGSETDMNLLLDLFQADELS